MKNFQSIQGIAIFWYSVTAIGCIAAVIIILPILFQFMFTPIVYSAQEDTAVAFRDIHQKTELSNAEICNIVSDSMCNAEVASEEKLLSDGISPEKLSAVKEGETVYLSRKASVIYVSDEYIRIDAKRNPETTKRMWQIIAVTILIDIFSGLLLIVFGTKHAIAPIIRLTDSVSEVAGGNFDLVLENNYKGEVAELYDNFNKMTAELKNIEFLRKDFVNSVSHEFKTPIASIHGFAHMLLDKNNTPEEQEEFTNIILEESDRLSKLSMNLLRLTKLENQQLVKKDEVFLLDEQLRSTILILEPEWEKKSIGFDLSLSEIKILGDEDLLKQVWINLLGNAIRFSPEGGSIEVKLFRAGDKVKVMISDHGIGMDEETRARIFERFYQGDKEHSDKGNGLGLTIVKQILNLCGGSIYVDSAVGVGSTFTVVLPYDKA